MASDSSRPQPDDLQAAINAALARKRAEPQDPGQRREPRLDDPAGRRSVHETDEIGPVPMADEGPAPEIPPMPQYFEPDRAVQPGETVRREAGPRAKKRSLVWFFGPVIGVPAVIIVALVYYLGVEMQGEGVQDSAPLIAAPTDPAKVKPTDEGGLAVPDQDKLIYSEISPTEAEQPVEQLLPEPEQPQVPAASGEQAVAPSTEGLTPPPAPTVEVPSSEPVESAATEPAPAEATTEPAASPGPADGAEPAATPEPAAPAETASPEPAATETASTAASGFRIQLAALKSEAAADAAWAKLQGKYPDLLGDLKPTIQRIDLGASGIFYRVQGGPLEGRSAAQNLCGKLNQRGQQCLVVQP
jgi:cell division septation protein DedD